MLSSKGFTLIELTIVLLLIGIMFSITIPKFQETLIDNSLLSAEELIINSIKSCKDDAAQKNSIYTLHFDINEGIFWITDSKMTTEQQARGRERSESLPKDITIKNICHVGAQNDGFSKSTITITPKGYAQPSIIHLKSDEEEVSLILRPFLSRIDITDEYIDCEDFYSPSN